MADKIKLSERIKSFRQTVGRDYDRPSPDKLQGLIKALWENPDAVKYLLYERNLAESTVRHFQLGFDTSRNAISIPIFKDGVLCNIKYRFLGENEQRYDGEVNAEMWLFNEAGVGEARKKGAILVVEGEFDCMAAWQGGIKNVVSTSGGKDSFGIWLEQIDSIPKIYIAFDNDDGGKASARKLAERLGPDRCLDINYQDCKDANEFLTKHIFSSQEHSLKGGKGISPNSLRTCQNASLSWTMLFKER